MAFIVNHQLLGLLRLLFYRRLMLGNQLRAVNRNTDGALGAVNPAVVVQQQIFAGAADRRVGAVIPCRRGVGKACVSCFSCCCCMAALDSMLRSLPDG